MKNNVTSCIEHNKCVGCKACEDACAVNAISFKEDKEGFFYPDVDDEKCVNCGRCLETCPVNIQTKPLEDKPKCFSAWSKTDKVRNESTSGGFFYELSREILQDNGVVIGARYSEDYKRIYHAEAGNIEELKDLMGSKYAQSDTGGIFKIIEGHLRNNRKVLFAGTPCQCAGVHRYIEGKKLSENLYLMDFVCYAIYSPLVYRKWLEELECQEKSKICRLRFKSKKFGWENRYVEIEFENGTTKYQSDLKGEDLFIEGIEDSDLYQRLSCFNCQFREEFHRNSDFTVGDFWGIKSQTEYDMFKGISFAIANSSKAVSMIKRLHKSMVIRPCDVSDIKHGNPNMIVNPVLQAEKRKMFFTNLRNNSFSKSLNKVIKKRRTKKPSEFNELLKILFDKNVDTFKYVYYNYFCKNVVRNGLAKVIPYKNSIICLDKNSKLILEGFRNFNIGVNKLHGSKAETYLRLSRDATMLLKHGADLCYGTTVEIWENAELEAGYFSANTGTVIGVDYRMNFGEYVGFGRNNKVYDSDFHAMLTSSGAVANKPNKTEIGSHVWITSNNTILSGSIIGDNSVIGSGNHINYCVPPNSFVRDNKVLQFTGWWSERSNMKGEILVRDKKLILVGFGKEGKAFFSKNKKQVEAIIDNHSNSQLTVSFKEFIKEKKFIDQDEAFVICSSKYFDELYQMVRERYPDALIVSNNQFFSKE